MNSDPTIPLFSIAWDADASKLTVDLHGWVIAGIVLLALAGLVWLWVRRASFLGKFEIDKAELGVGNQKITFRPNRSDQEVAFKLWVELSTRKIGLPINFDDDVLVEIYDSWYSFFSVARELLKDVPITKVRQKSTQAIIELSVEVLNEGLRPHLTKWQARYRAWHEREMRQRGLSEPETFYDPQEIQKNFPDYSDLVEDMTRVNQLLIRYRDKMYQLVLAA